MPSADARLVTPTMKAADQHQHDDAADEFIDLAAEDQSGAARDHREQRNGEGDWAGEIVLECCQWGVPGEASATRGCGVRGRRIKGGADNKSQ